jgi:sulfur-oxidizing protein SoxY
MTKHSRGLTGLLATWLVLALIPIDGSAQAEVQHGPASPVWDTLRSRMFGTRPVTLDADASVIALETPPRAMDAAIVPIAVRGRIPQSPERYIRKIWLVVDRNPSPMGAEFTLTPASGRADMETRIRIEQYTHVRAVAELNDGSLFMAVRYVKAAGGCSAPAGKDLAAAMSSIGRIRLRVTGDPVAGEPVPAQLMVSHPNVTGLAMDQLTRQYAPAHYVRHVEVSYDGTPVMQAEVDFSISENPNFRFWFVAGGPGELSARVLDSEGLEFSQAITIRPASAGTARAAVPAGT